MRERVRVRVAAPGAGVFWEFFFWPGVWVLAAPGCGAALPSCRVSDPRRGGDPECGDPATVRGAVLAFGGELLCGIGESQKRAAYGVGCKGDTSPLGGLLRSAARFARGNLLKNQNITSQTRLAARFFVTAG